MREDRGVLPTDAQLARIYDDRAKHPRILFTRDIQQILVRATWDFCNKRKFRFHGAGCDQSHIHLALSWKGYADCEEVQRRLKNVLSFLLGNELKRPGTQWFVRKGLPKRVKDRSHLDHLLNKYFPSHRFWWCEGDALP